MKISTFKKASMVALATALSTVAISAQAGSCEAPYRTYYLDSSCHYYYIDANGNKVMDGRYQSPQYMGRPLYRDCCSNRWFYLDAWGTRVYVSHRCGG